MADLGDQHTKGVGRMEDTFESVADCIELAALLAYPSYDEVSIKSSRHKATYTVEVFSGNKLLVSCKGSKEIEAAKKALDTTLSLIKL
jgi:dsRNA-specific ribonuclease